MQGFVCVHFTTLKKYHSKRYHTHTQRPKLSTVTGKTIAVYGKRCVKYRLDHSLTLSITYWVCDVQHPLLSVRSLMKSNLQLVFSPQRCYINKPGTDKLVTLVENGPLYYLPTQGRTTSTSTSSTSTLQTQPTTTSTSTSLQLDKTDLYNTYIAPLEQQPEPKPTSWSDY